MNKYKCTLCGDTGIIHVPVYEENFGWVYVDLPENVEPCDVCVTEKGETDEKDH